MAPTQDQPGSRVHYGTTTRFQSTGGGGGGGGGVGGGISYSSNQYRSGGGGGGGGISYSGGGGGGGISYSSGGGGGGGGGISYSSNQYNSGGGAGGGGGGGGGGISYSSNQYNSGGHGDAQWSRVDEKRRLQDIHERFEAYIKRVSELGNQGGDSQASAFLATIQNVEDSVAGMKASYEQEIDGLRRQIAGFGSEKAEWSAALNGLQQKNNNLNTELASERAKNEKLSSELNGLVSQNNTLNQEINDLRLKLQAMETAMSRHEDNHGTLHVSYSDLQAQLQDLTKRLEDEQRMRHEAEEAANQLRQKLDFQDRMKDQELGQLMSRLDGANSMIMDLEAKVREMAQNEGKLPELLRRVREAAEEDLKRYKAEAEQEFAAKIAALQDKYADDARQLAELKAENDQLKANIADLQGQINTLHSQLNGLLQERDGLSLSLTEERKRHGDQIRDFQNRIESLNEVYVKRIQEVNVGGDGKVSLQPEMESMLILLEEEEKRVLNSSRPEVSGEHRLVYYPTQGAANVSSHHTHTNTYSGPGAGAHAQYGGGANAHAQYGGGASAYGQYGGGGGAHGHHDHTCRQQPCAEHQHYATSMSQSIGPVGKVSYKSQAPITQTRTQADADLQKLQSSQRINASPVSGRQRAGSLISQYRGQGRDYFDSMFNDLKRTHLATGEERPVSSTSHDYNTATNSQTGELCIHEVHPLGQYIRIHNTSDNKEMDMSNYQVQQNVGGRPVAVFRFPPKTKLAANATTTVWCADADPIRQNPPSDFICNEQQKWGTGPECTTILCKANGQAVAWCTAPHRLSRDAYAERAAMSPTASDTARNNFDEPPLTELPSKGQREPVFLQREKMEQPTFVPKKHPHGQDPSLQAHPNENVPRQKTLGNDNSSFNRQNRVPTIPVPDPVPVQYSSGASANRLGASPLKKPIIRGSGRLINKANGNIVYGPPSPFLSSLQQDFAQSKNSALVKFN